MGAILTELRTPTEHFLKADIGCPCVCTCTCCQTRRAPSWRPMFCCGCPLPARRNLDKEKPQNLVTWLGLGCVRTGGEQPFSTFLL